MLSSVAAVWATALCAVPIRLEDVRRASQDNVPVRLAALDERIRGEQVGLARSSVLPQLWIAGSAGYDWWGAQESLVAVQPDANASLVQQVFPFAAYQAPAYDFSVNASQLLFDGGKWWSQIGLSEADERQARALHDEQRRTAELEGVRRFYELYRVQAAADVLEELVAVSSQHFARARALAQAGLGKSVEVAAAEVNLGEDLISQTRNRAVLAAASASLSVWLARDGAEQLQAVAPPALNGPATPAPSLEQAWSAAKAHRALLEAVAAKERSAGFAETVASSGFWPSLSLQLKAGRAGNVSRPVFTEPSLQNYALGTLVLRWDLFSGLATVSRSGQARYEHEQASLQREQAEREVRGELHTALAALDTQIQASELARKNSEAAERAWDLARKHFESGTGSTLEVRDASLKRSQAHLEAISARIDVEIQRAAVERAMGTLE